MTKKRFAVVLVPVPEGSEVDGEVEVFPFPGINGAQGYLPLVSPVPSRPDVIRPSASPQVVQRPLESTVRSMRDLRPLKRSVAHLPSNHPLRLALRGEPDWLPYEVARRKLLEWVKYVDWTVR